MRIALLLLAVSLASCATRSPSSSQWSKIEGCWAERADHWPTYMTWRRDHEQPGRYLGYWRREAAQGDLDEVHFVLTPAGDHMQLCQQFPGGGGRCDRAVFGRAGWREDAVAVFDVDAVDDPHADAYHEFGYAGATMPLFWGYGGPCEDR